MSTVKSLLPAALLTLAASGAHAQATVKETVQNVVTYPFSDPNPVARPEETIYPYFHFDGYSSKGTTQPWKVVTLENDYIEVTLLPDMGGKVWGAIDKTTGHEFIYKNPVMKFRNIAMRGPWTSGGIEFNFGLIGHVPSTVTPVDYATRQKADGSASCYVSSYDWATHTWWTVEVNVPKDKAYFTTNTTWHNASGTWQPYYQWMNAAYLAKDGAVFDYPGTAYIGHGGELHPFPIENGNDIATYNGNDSLPAVSYHIVGDYSGLYGVYYKREGFGSGHYADYADKLGKKIFLWGRGRAGDIWADLLTDRHGQYIELQAGRLFNQPISATVYTPYKHPRFTPLGTDTWTEYWFPVETIGDMLAANEHAALNVERRDGQLVISLSPLERLQTTLTVADGDRVMKTFDVTVEPLKTWQATLPLVGGLASKGTLKVTLGDRLLTYSELKDDNETDRPKVIPDGFDWSSAYGHYLLGDNALNQKYYAEAETELRAALQKDSLYQPALTSMGSLMVHLGRWADARTYLRKALALDTYDGRANYLWGQCNQALGRTTDAKDGYSIASRTEGLRSAAYTKLAEVFLAEGETGKALEFARRAVRVDDSNLSAATLLASIYIKRGETAEAQAIAKRVVDDQPLYHPMRYAAYRAGLMSRDDFMKAVRCELPAEVYIELADNQERAGLLEEALDLFSMAKDNPTALYRAAYIMHRQGKDDEALATVKKADALSPRLVLPHRATTLPALTWANAQTHSWKTVYYRALVLWANLQKAEATQLLDGIEDADFAPFYLLRAQTREGSARLADIQRAEQAERSWRTGDALLTYYLSAADYRAAIATGKRYVKWYPDNYILAQKYVKALNKSGRYDEAIHQLAGLTVLPSEGFTESHTIYRDAHLGKAIGLMKKGRNSQALQEIALAGQWPENLGVGKPLDKYNDTRLEDFLRARVAEAQGDKLAANALYHKVVAKPNPSTFTSYELLSALSLKALGQTAEADARVNQWTQKFADNQLAAWCAQLYRGQKLGNQFARRGTTEAEQKAAWEKQPIQDANFELIVKLLE